MSVLGGPGAQFYSPGRIAAAIELQSKKEEVEQLKRSNILRKKEKSSTAREKKELKKKEKAQVRVLKQEEARQEKAEKEAQKNQLTAVAQARGKAPKSHTKVPKAFMPAGNKKNLSSNSSPAVTERPVAPVLQINSRGRQVIAPKRYGN
ncbi:MAG: hypothetical protein M1829_000047 [Trizodia sp. TS-e1964]|nr:MAG: hypothetical protein M1829_000047 [Trizodia sp. TS-e1964]